MPLMGQQPEYMEVLCAAPGVLLLPACIVSFKLPVERLLTGGALQHFKRLRAELLEPPQAVVCVCPPHPPVRANPSSLCQHVQTWLVYHISVAFFCACSCGAAGGIGALGGRQANCYGWREDRAPV